jgi:hypothetical protein
MTAPRLALITAAAATLLLAACSSPAPAPADPTPTEPPAPEVAVLSDLDFPNGLTEWLGPLGEHKAELADWYDAYTAECTAEQAGSADAPDCTEGILTGLKAVNAIKTDFDFNVGDDDWGTGEFSGLVALDSTHETVLTASGSGSDFIDVCYYVPGGDGSGACVAPAQTFLDDVAALIDATSTWEL